MDDPIPAEFITLPEALQRIAGCVSEAHMESAKLDFQANARALAEIRREQRAIATSEASQSAMTDSDPCVGPFWLLDKRNFAVVKLICALQTGAVSAIVRSPGYGELFRLIPADWHFEPFREQIIRGGIIPPYASKGFECHAGRTVVLEMRILKNG
ncbi:hypothetical protein ACO2JO_04330 [Leptospira interrogans]